MLNNNIPLDNKTVLITGVAGFIGSYLAMRLLSEYKNLVLIGVDSISDYYDVNLKYGRLEKIKETGGNFSFFQLSISDKTVVQDLFQSHKFDIVVNLAAQAGVRYSISNPDSYIESNIIGFYNILEACRMHQVKHLVYASSSSVYGLNKKTPYSIEDKVATPVSLYAATKLSDELLAHSHSVIFNLPTTGLRFFTVYGPCGRPDMAYFSFSEKLIKGENIKVFNYGKCMRDFTYIDDIVEGIVRVMQHAPESKVDSDGHSIPPYRLYNIGNNKPENLLDFIKVLCEELQQVGLLPDNFDLDSHIDFVPMQPGDVYSTCADTAPLKNDFGYKPETPLRTGLRRFVVWYKDYLALIKKIKKLGC